jgi:hypothetical protein
LGSSLPLNVKTALENKPTTVNFHHYCMRPEVKNKNLILLYINKTYCIFLLIKNFSTDPVLSTFYKMLTISSDLEGKTFVSIIESKYDL